MNWSIAQASKVENAKWGPKSGIWDLNSIDEIDSAISDIVELMQLVNSGPPINIQIKNCHHVPKSCAELSLQPFYSLSLGAVNEYRDAINSIDLLRPKTADELITAQFRKYNS